METSDQLNIKGMVCNRCVQTIREVLHQIGYTFDSISLGKVIFNQSLHPHEIEAVRSAISGLGFELLEDQNQKLIKEIRSSIQELVELNMGGERSQNLSAYLSSRFNRSYDSLSELFGRFEGITLEKYYIYIRLDKVKELLVYTDFTLSEIAFKAGFSSPFHLSNHFKVQMGQNPSKFREMRRQALTVSEVQMNLETNAGNSVNGSNRS